MDANDSDLEYSEVEESSYSWEDSESETSHNGKTHQGGKIASSLWISIDTLDFTTPSHIATMERLRQFSFNELGHTQHRIWQIQAASAILHGHDVLVTAGTGSGKSAIYQMLLQGSTMNATLIVVSPLVALINEQVAFMQSKGISVAGVTKQALKANPKLWLEIEKGEHRIVFITPEQLLTNESFFWHKLAPQAKTNTWCKNVKCIVVDETHLIWKWGKSNFRKEYDNIGFMRAYFPKVPFLLLSATVTTVVRGYLHKTLDLARPTIWVQESIKRTNIRFIVAPIRSAKGDFADLEFILKTMPKTMIFVDNRKISQAIAIYLRSKLPSHIPEAVARRLIAVFHSVVDEFTAGEDMEAFRQGNCKILICTDAAGMGMDIRDVEVVIQYRIPDFLDITDIWQRMGRCARDSSLCGMALVLVEERFLLLGGCTKFANTDIDFTFAIGSFDEAHQLQAVKNHIIRLYSEEAGMRNSTNGVLRIDPYLLWWLNTKGCRTRVALAVFDDPDTYSDFNCKCDYCMFCQWDSVNHLLPPSNIVEKLKADIHAMHPSTHKRKTHGSLKTKIMSVPSTSSDTASSCAAVGVEESVYSLGEKRGRRSGPSCQVKDEVNLPVSSLSLEDTIQRRELAVFNENFQLECEYSQDEFFGFNMKERSMRFQDSASRERLQIDKEEAKLIAEIQEEMMDGYISDPIGTVKKLTKAEQGVAQANIISKLTAYIDRIYEEDNIQAVFAVRRSAFCSAKQIERISKSAVTRMNNGEEFTIDHLAAGFGTAATTNLKTSAFGNHVDGLMQEIHEEFGRIARKTKTRHSTSKKHRGGDVQDYEHALEMSYRINQAKLLAKGNVLESNLGKAIKKPVLPKVGEKKNSKITAEKARELGL